MTCSIRCPVSRIGHSLIVTFLDTGIKTNPSPKTVQGIGREIGHLFFMAVLANSGKRVADFAFRCDHYINVPLDYYLNAQGAYPCRVFLHRG